MLRMLWLGVFLGATLSVAGGMIFDHFEHMNFASSINIPAPEPAAVILP